MYLPANRHQSGVNCIEIKPADSQAVTVLGGEYEAKWTAQSQFAAQLEVTVFDSRTGYLGNSSSKNSPLNYSFGALPVLQEGSFYGWALQLNSPGALAEQSVVAQLTLVISGTPPKAAAGGCAAG